MHGVLILGLFIGAVALAAYVNDWQDLKRYTSRKDIISALEDIISSSQATVVSLLFPHSGKTLYIFYFICRHSASFFWLWMLP